MFLENPQISQLPRAKIRFVKDNQIKLPSNYIWKPAYKLNSKTHLFKE
jgi:hypothetical protein